MLSKPRIEMRQAQPYVAIRREVKMNGIGRVLQPLLADVAAWMNEERIRTVGDPFLRYHRTDMDTNRFLVDVGWPVAEEISGAGQIIGDTLPAGRYAVVTNTGPFDNLFDAYNALFDWGEETGISWQIDADKRWGARIERYLTDPADEPDSQLWQAEIALLIAES